MDTGTVFDIMKYSIHDGPGIRTTVFLKGCPLHCLWCHNPESQSGAREIMFREDRCIGCGDCLKACPNEAVTNSDKCTLCGNCAGVCPSGARELVGRKVTVRQVMEELEKDVIFYDQSGGGVTFSGGEPFMQPGFLNSLLEACKEKEIHTAVETAGFVNPETLLKIRRNVDLFLYDLKLMDDEKHKKFTGVPNRLILDNLKELALHHSKIIIRVPIIPGMNDDDENILNTGKFVASLNSLKEINILPYHKAGAEKYKRLHKAYALPETQPPDSQKMADIAKKLEKYHLKVRIGG